jgi:hypothetical protein
MQEYQEQSNEAKFAEIYFTFGIIAAFNKEQFLHANRTTIASRSRAHN